MSHADEFQQLEGALANLDDLIGSMTKDTVKPEQNIPQGDVDLDAIIADLTKSFPVSSNTSASTSDYAHLEPQESYQSATRDYAHLGPTEQKSGPYTDYAHLTPVEKSTAYTDYAHLAQTATESTVHCAQLHPAKPNSVSTADYAHLESVEPNQVSADYAHLTEQKLVSTNSFGRRQPQGTNSATMGNYAKPPPLGVKPAPTVLSQRLQVGPKSASMGDFAKLSGTQPTQDNAHLQDNDDVFLEETKDNIGPGLKTFTNTWYNPMMRSQSLPGNKLFPDGRSYEQTIEQTSSPQPYPQPNVPIPAPPSPKRHTSSTGSEEGAQGLRQPLPTAFREGTGQNSKGHYSPPIPPRTTAKLERSTSERSPSNPMDRKFSLPEVVVNFYNVDRSYKTLAIEESFKARDICNKLVLKNVAHDDKNWMLVEFITKFNIQRIIEDHEAVLPVYDSWEGDMDNLFYFKNDFKKYEIFQNPAQFFPSHMITQQEVEGVLSEKAEKAKKILLQNMFTTTDRVPDIESYLHLKEHGKKNWKRAFCMLRGKRIVYSTKGTSKDPKYLVTYVIFDDLDLYLARKAKETFGAPNDVCFCLKPQRDVSEAKDLICLCADDAKSLKCWMAAIRLAKYSGQLRENYRIAVRRMEKLKKLRLRETDEGGVTGPYSDQPWYHGRLSREETSARIIKQGFKDGAFLVRDSQSSPGSFVISFAYKKKILHYQVLPLKIEAETFYSIDEGQTKFYDVTDLINYHMKEKGVMPILLTENIKKEE